MDDNMIWKRSSKSGHNGNCVEVGCAHESRTWRKSTRSQSNGDCVEAAQVAAVVAIRDSKLDTTGDFPVLTMTHGDWSAMLTGIRSGSFDS